MKDPGRLFLLPLPGSTLSFFATVHLHLFSLMWYIVVMKFYSAEDLSIMFSVTVRTIWNWRRRGILPPPVRLGGVVRWRGDVIDRWARVREEVS